MMAVTFPQLMQRLAPLGGPLAGRERELDDLRRAWADAQDGACRLVLVAGEAGVGKTRLAAELAGEVEAAGGDVVVGSCPAGGAEPFHPLIEALGPVPVGHRDRDAAFGELASAAVARARRTPMLLVLDDLHRTDRSTLLALRRIVEADRGPCPLLVVATYRDTVVDRSHPLSEFLTAVLARPDVQRIALEGLAPDALVDLVGDAEVARRVWRQSEGNPVRVRELVRLGALDRPLPPSFDELVARRMAGLSPSTRRFLEAAAVVGSEFSVPAATAAAELPPDQVSSALRQLAAAGFVVEEPAGPGETRRFVHDMVREAIAARLEPLVRVRLHLRVGQALEHLDPRAGAPAALVAWHFRAAAPVGGSAPALRHSTSAAERAMELMAWEEAAVHYGYALAAATGAAAGVRADLLLSLGEAQRLAGEAARARQAFLEAAKLARICSDGARLARASLALGQVAAVWGADPELEELAGEARSLLGPAGPAATVFSPETDFASDVLYDVLDGVHRTPRPAPAPTPPPAVDPAAAAILRARHVALAGPEHTPDRLATAEEIVALADEIGDDDLSVTGWGWGLLDSMELGRLEEAAVHQAAHREVASRLADPRHSADVAAWVAMRAMLEGRVDDAGAAAANAYAFALEAGDPEAEESYLLQRWWMALEWATADELTQIAHECRARASASAGGRTWRAAAALALARAGRLDQAGDELHHATDHGLGELIRHPQRLHPLSCLVEVAWMLGDGYRAATVGPLLEPFADRMIVAGRGLACRGSVSRACGLMAASAHRWDEAEAHFEAALAAHRRMGALPLLARTRLEWSLVLAERGRKGDRRRAADLRRKSGDLAGRLAMTRLLEEVARPAP